MVPVNQVVLIVIFSCLQEKAWENLNRLTTEEPDREMEIDLLKIATK